jgi:hypothetical protein
MKYQIPTLLFIFFIFQNIVNAQNIETKEYKLKEFGILSIPNFLDTLGQDIGKKVIIENVIEEMSLSGKKSIGNQYSIDLTKTFLSNYDSSIFLFWPNKTLFYLLELNFNNQNKDTSTDAGLFEVVPNIVLQRKSFAYSSAQMKRLFSNKEKAAKFTNTLTDSYVSALEMLFPNVKIDNVTSRLFFYLNDFPIVKITFKYIITEGNKISSYTQDLYTMYKKNYNYLFRFEYKSEDERKWTLYEETFFKSIKLL